ncbi:DinB family protein [Candidatus Bathyarchaeota archaeon]|nr:DinB family protein [Candidatus Bathyarchaeota archaeon]
MKETKVLYDQIESTFKGKSWHGPNLIQLLEGVTAETANLHPILKRHSIWELVNHMNYWMQIALKDLNEFESPIMEGKEDWSFTGISENEWQISVTALEKTVNRLLIVLTNFSETKLNEKVPNKNYTYRYLLFGVLNHNLYHMGQIAVLK